MGVIFRQSAKGTIVTLVGAAIGFLSTFFIATKLLTPEEVGLTRVLVEVATLMSGLALLATQSSAVRYYPFFQTPDGGDRGFLRWLILVPAVGFLIFSAIYLIFQAPFTAYFAENDSSGLFGRYYFVVLPLVLFIMYQTISEVYSSLKQRVAVPKFVREVLLRILLIIAYLLYGFTQLSYSGFLAIFVAAYGICMLLNLLYTSRLNPMGLRAKREPIPSDLKRDWSRYTLFTVLSALGGTLVTRLDLFMVSSQMGFSYGGVYTIAFFIVAIIEMPSRSLMSMSSPLVSQALHKKEIGEVNRIYKRVSHHQLLSSLLLFVLIWTNIDTLFSIIPNSEIYSQGKWVVFILGLARMADLTFNFGNAILHYSKYYPWTLIYTILVTFLTILLNYFLIQWIGMEGAAVGTLVTYLVSNSFQQMVLTRKLGVSPADKELGRLCFTLLILLLIEWILPKTGYVWVDSIWRTAVIMILGWVMLRKITTFQELIIEARKLFRK